MIAIIANAVIIECFIREPYHIDIFMHWPLTRQSGIDTTVMWRQPDEESKPSYAKRILLSNASLFGFVASTIASAGLAIPFDLPVAAIPVVAVGITIAAAAALLPLRRSYREKLDGEHRDLVREHERVRLKKRIHKRSGYSFDAWPIYQQLCDQVADLKKNAISTTSLITKEDAETLDDASIRFLQLWVAHIALDERDDNDDSLMQKKSDVKSAMMALFESSDNIYHKAVVASSAGKAENVVAEAADRVRIDAEIAAAVDEELREMFGPPASTKLKL